MTFDEYQRAAARTWHVDLHPDLQLVHAALGLTGEAGETAELVKKATFHGHALDTDAAIKELGDVLYYVAALCNVLGLSLATVAETNIAKLQKRYPNGFSQADSIARVDVVVD